MSNIDWNSITPGKTELKFTSNFHEYFDNRVFYLVIECKEDSLIFLDKYKCAYYFEKRVLGDYFKMEQHKIKKEAESKTVYTQEMHSKSESPLVGMLLNISFIGGNSFIKSELTYLGDGVGCFKDEKGKEFTFSTDSIIFDYIKTRTDKEKLADDLRSAIDQCNVLGFVDRILNDEISNLKFTGGLTDG